MHVSAAHESGQDPLLTGSLSSNEKVILGSLCFDLLWIREIRASDEPSVRRGNGEWATKILHRVGRRGDRCADGDEAEDERQRRDRLRIEQTLTRPHAKLASSLVIGASLRSPMASSDT